MYVTRQLRGPVWHSLERWLPPACPPSTTTCAWSWQNPTRPQRRPCEIAGMLEPPPQPQMAQDARRGCKTVRSLDYSAWSRRGLYAHRLGEATRMCMFRICLMQMETASRWLELHKAGDQPPVLHLEINQGNYGGGPSPGMASDGPAAVIEDSGGTEMFQECSPTTTIASACGRGARAEAPQRPTGRPEHGGLGFQTPRLPAQSTSVPEDSRGGHPRLHSPPKPEERRRQERATEPWGWVSPDAWEPLWPSSPFAFGPGALRF